MELLRDAPIGQVVRLVTGNKYFQYPEEKPDFVCPQSYYGDDGGDVNEAPEPSSPTSSISSSSSSSPNFEKDVEKAESTAPNPLSTIQTEPDHESHPASRSHTKSSRRTLSQVVSRVDFSKTRTADDVEQAYEAAAKQETIKTQASRPIQPQKTHDGRILVDWYTTDDPENPQNWSRGRKIIVILQIYLYTLAVYIASAIYTPSVPYVMKEFGISGTVASLGLSMYVLGYGMGPLLFSPLSEIPFIGRNPPYIITFFIYIMLGIGSATVNNFPGLVVLRYLQGFFGSPALATGGASVGDIFDLLQLPYYLTLWAAFATAGPALGPLVSGFSVPKTNWHWSLWEVVWLAAPVFVSMFLLLPETSSQTILLRRAQRLRKITGKSNLVAQSEIDQAEMSVKQVVIGNLWRPVQINALDPSVLFTSVYIGLLYGIFYSFFESFPLVYSTGLGPNSPTQGYGMNAGQEGLVFLSIAVGVVIAIAIYVLYLHFSFDPALRARLAAGQGIGAPERRLVPGLYASFFVPVGLFIFAWTGFNSPKIHWIVPTLGITVFTVAVFILFQVIFIYIPLTYPQYAASLFAGNDMARSSIAAGAIHFAQPLFRNLGIGRGVSLLAGLTVIGVIGIWTLYYGGAWLRSKSRFAAK